MAEGQLEAGDPGVQGYDTPDGGEGVLVAGDVYRDEEAYSIEGGDVCVDVDFWCGR